MANIYCTIRRLLKRQFGECIIDEQHGKAGQYILTGSAKLKDNSGRHSGTGRIAQIRMSQKTIWIHLLQ